ncbi:transposase-like zinc-binding domain-containing protein [Inhella proteolytica]|uniref:transposase-like zinc-binding domain-containing protein n=1 Tax=Inhella proteolytica TaxID=2795029 RepID=UPI004046AFCA
MREDEWTSWLACLGRLSAEQLLQLRQCLDAVAAVDALEAALLRWRSQHPECPHCQGLYVVSNGHADGRQRYKCRRTSTRAM